MDDYLAFVAMALTGTTTVAVGVVTLLHFMLSYGVIRKAQIAAAASDVWMLSTGVAMWVIARHRGGDWAGLGILGAWLVIAVGTLLLVLSLIALRYMRRMRPGNNSTV
jgi:hypothetical protein